MTKIWIKENVELYPVTVIDVVDKPEARNWEWDVPDFLVTKLEKSQVNIGDARRAILDYIDENPECQNLVLTEYRLQLKREEVERKVEAQRLNKRFAKVITGFMVFITFLAILLGLLGLGVF